MTRQGQADFAKAARSLENVTRFRVLAEFVLELAKRLFGSQQDDLSGELLSFDEARDEHAGILHLV